MSLDRLDHPMPLDHLSLDPRTPDLRKVAQ
jgi:hypothetical protein